MVELVEAVTEIIYITVSIPDPFFHPNVKEKSWSGLQDYGKPLLNRVRSLPLSKFTTHATEMTDYNHSDILAQPSQF